MAADWIVANRFYRPRESAEEGRDAVAQFAESLGSETEGDESDEAGVDAAPRPAGRPGPPPLPPVTGAPA